MENTSTDMHFNRSLGSYSSPLDELNAKIVLSLLYSLVLLLCILGKFFILDI